MNQPEVRVASLQVQVQHVEPSPGHHPHSSLSHVKHRLAQGAQRDLAGDLVAQGLADLWWPLIAEDLHTRLATCKESMAPSHVGHNGEPQHVLVTLDDLATEQEVVQRLGQGAFLWVSRPQNPKTPNNT